MKVAYDVSTLNKPWLSGMGVWMVNLFQHMNLSNGLAPKIQPVCKLSRVRQRAVMQSHLNQSVKPWIPFFSEGAYDVFHGPDFRLPNGLKIPQVVSIADIAFYEEGMTSPDFAAKKMAEVEHLLRKQKPESVIVISEYTKGEVLKRFPEYESKIYVTLLGHEHLLLGEQKQKLANPEQRPYVLFVGNLEARKNVFRLLQAFDQLCENHPDLDEDLILIGRPGFGYEMIEKTLTGLKHKDRIRQLGFVENEQMVAYYQNARAFAYPSLIEGFGIPLLEAMLNGCPVLTANITATAEVSGDAAIQVDPYSVDDIEQGLYTLLSDSELSQQLIEKGHNRVQSFTWKSCAQRTLEVYKKTGSQ